MELGEKNEEKYQETIHEKWLKNGKCFLANRNEKHRKIEIRIVNVKTINQKYEKEKKIR